MYTPNLHRIEDRATLVGFMRAHPFAVLITAEDGAPTATHLPCAIETTGESPIRIRAHMARANPQWKALERGAEALVIFSGPHAYISPRHYESRVAVPTWNYVAVHASGRARLVEPLDERRAMLEQLIRESEPAYLAQFASLPPDYVQRMLGAITAFEIEVERLEARYKLSQEKRPIERGRIVAELQAAEDSAAVETGRLMREHGALASPAEYRLVEALTPEDLEAARTLFREYHDWLGVDLCFQGFDAELATLPGAYARPDGRLFLVKRDREAVACIALRRFDAAAGEVKRLYVRPAHRGAGLGATLARAAIDAARETGYARLVLDTLARMKEAGALYRGLGFREIPAYYANPLPDAVYMALDLNASSSR